MSTLKVTVVRARNVRPLANADTLDTVSVAGWVCVVKRGSVRDGDLGVYFPIDAVLPPKVMDGVFKEAKVKPHNGRVKTVKIRGYISQGLFVPLWQLRGLEADGYSPEAIYSEGDDVAAEFGITKYELPVWDQVRLNRQKKMTRKRRNPHFSEYTDIEHFKWYPDAIAIGEPVAITEKIMGTSARAGYVPRVAHTWWEKLQAALGLLPKWEFVYGSRRVQLQYSGHQTTSYYDDDVWGQWVKNYRLREKLKPGEVVYGEIYGPGIQPGYGYGVADGVREFAVYDVQVDGRWLDHFELVRWCIERELPMVPTIAAGPYTPQLLEMCTDGPSLLHPETKVREGCVVRPIFERNRTVLKSVSAEFLLGNQDAVTEHPH